MPKTSKKASVTDVIKAIEDVVKESFSDAFTVTVIVTNIYDSERTEKVDNTKLGIAFGSHMLEKYTTALTSPMVPSTKKKGIKTYYLFMEDFQTMDEALKKTQTEKAIKFINASDVVIISGAFEKLSDYNGYFSFLDMLSEKPSMFTNHNLIGNIVIAKSVNAPNMNLECERLSRIFTIPKGSIVVWSGDNTSTLKTNMDGFQQINSNDIHDTMGNQIKICIDSSMKYMLDTRK